MKVSPEKLVRDHLKEVTAYSSARDEFEGSLNYFERAIHRFHYKDATSVFGSTPLNHLTGVLRDHYGKGLWRKRIGLMAGGLLAVSAAYLATAVEPKVKLKEGPSTQAPSLYDPRTNSLKAAVPPISSATAAFQPTQWAPNQQSKPNPLPFQIQTAPPAQPGGLS